ncbi:MAG: cytochrome c oxidase assembly protein [Alphaproteobacteria bacterium]
MSSTDPSKPRFSNGKVAAFCLVIFAAMVGAGFAAVPLYRAFCQATGFDGTISRAEAAPLTAKILNKTIVVRFDTNTRDVPWTFTPEDVSQTVRIGETKLTHFKVTNNSKHAVSAQATFNILPESAGAYFKKTQCFCFEEQTLQPGETEEFAVVYFVDPKFDSDPETRGTPELTLSYTFFPSKGGEIELPVASAAR